MQFLGYKKKKGSSGYFTDDILNPTYFRSHQKYRWEEPDDSIEFKGRQPVFTLNFKMEGIQGIASGAEIYILDIDTDRKYSIYTQEIFNLFEYLREGLISLNGTIYTGTFILQKVGKSYGLKLATQEDIDLIDDEIPEIV